MGIKNNKLFENNMGNEDNEPIYDKINNNIINGNRNKNV